MADMRLVSQSLYTDVTCVYFVGGHVFAGMGNCLCIFDVASARLQKRVEMFEGQKVHGVCAGIEGRMLVFGGKRLSVVSFELQGEVRVSKVSSWVLDQWILCTCWLDRGIRVAVATAQNVVSLWDWRTKERLATAYCEEKCILYSALLVGESWRDLTLLAGTMFKEVVVWVPATATSAPTDCPVVQRLRGHKGVVFSVSYDAATGRLYTTSDDRSVRVWGVQPPRPLRWDLAVVRLLSTLFGHRARVWRSIGLEDGVVSIGEDSQLCVWSPSGQLVRRWSTHQGGSVWSVDCSRDLGLIVTGGGDGGISLWPLNSWKEDATRLASVPFPEEWVPRRVALLASGRAIATTEQGNLLHMRLRHWKCVHTDARLAKYCLLKVAPCRRLVGLATLCGHLLVFREAEEADADSPLVKVVDLSLVQGKIFSLHWVSSSRILTCTSQGRLQLWGLSKDAGGSVSLREMRQLSLPPCKERWLTSALLQASLLACGDRHGNIHLYDLSEASPHNAGPCQTMAHMHSRLGVSSLEVHRDVVFSTGRDGTVRQYRLCEGERRLRLVCVHHLPMEWVAATMASCHGLLVAGFIQTLFVLWSHQEQRMVAELPCGGGHRSWDCMVDSHGFTFAYVKDRLVHVAVCSFHHLVKPILQAGLHVRNVNCVRLLARPGGGHPLVVSAGEDMTIRVVDGLSLRGLSVQRGHISSIRALALCQLRNHTTLLFSAGGRSQMKVWQLMVAPARTDSADQVTWRELASHMLKPGNCDNITEPSVDSESRYMSLCVAATGQDSAVVLVGAGCSDGFLRLFCYDTDKRELRPVASYAYHGCCILNVSFLLPDVGVSMATDGRVALWDLGAAAAQLSDPGSPDHPGTGVAPFCAWKLHQSGVNSYDSVDMGDGTVLLATGGDDNAMALTLLRVAPRRPPAEATKLLEWRLDNAHAAQVTGLAFIRHHLVSTSVDQRVLVWLWQCDRQWCVLRATLVAQFCSSVADLQGLCAWLSGDSMTVCVYGRGMEVLHCHGDGRGGGEEEHDDATCQLVQDLSLQAATAHH